MNRSGNRPRNGLLVGRSVVVTGSTRGIGLAIAREMAECGADVMIHGRDRARAEEARDALAASAPPLAGRDHGFLVRDLADPDNHARFVEDAWRWASGGLESESGDASSPNQATLEPNSVPVSTSRSRTSTPDASGPGTTTSRGADRAGSGANRGVDIWVNNAGVDVLTGTAADWTFAEKLEALWQVDVLATIRLSRFVLERMKPHGGAIINIGWDQASVGMAGDSGEMFAAVKGAVMAFTKSLAKSAAPTVRVNCVAPGWIRTEWGESANAYWNTRAVGESLVGRWGEPIDVARAVRFLASPDASFLNGQTLEVNGGLQSWSCEVNDG